MDSDSKKKVNNIIPEIENENSCTFGSIPVGVSIEDRQELVSLTSSNHESNSNLDEGFDDEMALYEEYGETGSESDDQDFIEDYENIFPYSCSSESFPRKVVWDHTLKHSSFYEDARGRRQQYLENRSRGTIPILHFTGTRKTHYWGRYGVEPNKVLPPGSIHGIQNMFADEEFPKLGPTERRIHINGQKFKIVTNEEITDSLYRAIAQALDMIEDEYELVHEAILHELTKQWSLFYEDICTYCGKHTASATADFLDSEKMITKYRNITCGSGTPPTFELLAAALHFGFSFSVMELTNSEQPVLVKNCSNDRVLLKSTAKFTFLKTGKNYPYYEFLLPIGPLKKIPNGMYPVVLTDVILVEKCRPGQTVSGSGSSKNHPYVGSVPFGFALDHRIFFHRSTVSHDLWSLLAELIFGKLIHAPQIKSKIIDNKHDFALYYLACKAKKRYQVSGNASIEKLAADFSKRFSIENPRGDLEDLAQAALYFDFSYTVIGFDARGNFFWRDYVSQHEVNNSNGLYLAFFVKTKSNRDAFWYALEDIGRSCPKERRLYHDVQLGDLRKWGGRFYFHNTPTKISSFVNKRTYSSSRYLLKAPAVMLSHATKWATSNFGRLRSTLIASTATKSATTFRATRNIFQSVLEFFRGIHKSSKKIHPDDKKVEALYVREEP